MNPIIYLIIGIIIGLIISRMLAKKDERPEAIKAFSQICIVLSVFIRV